MIPVVKFSDFLAKLEVIKKECDPPFYAMILYKEQHIEFRNFILSKFNEIHDYTGDVAFILIDQPPHEWLQRVDTGYYSEWMGENYLPKLNDYEVDVMCECLKASPKGLPYVIFFSNYWRKDFNRFSFLGVDIDIVERFFMHLWDSTSKFTYQKENFIDLMIETRRQFPKLNTKIEKIEPHTVEYALIQTLAKITELNVAKEKEVKKTPPKIKDNTKLNVHQQAELKCRAVAKQLWKEFPQMRIAEVSRHEEMVEVSKWPDGTLYVENTVRGWISDLCPDPKRGRPRKK